METVENEYDQYESIFNVTKKQNVITYDRHAKSTTISCSLKKSRPEVPLCPLFAPTVAKPF